MSKRNAKNERLITSNPDSDACLYKLTKRYLRFLGDHQGSLQPTCRAGHPLEPHAKRVVGYNLALADLRKVTLPPLYILNHLLIHYFLPFRLSQKLALMALNSQNIRISEAGQLMLLTKALKTSTSVKPEIGKMSEPLESILTKAPH